MDIKKLYNEKVKLADQFKALEDETERLFELLKAIKEFKKNNLDELQSQESKQTKIGLYFNQLNESVQYWEKGFIPQNNLINYQIYDPLKKEDLDH